MGLQSLQMLFGSIALVALPPILGMLLRCLQHHAVAPFLGDDRGCTNDGLLRITLDDSARGPAPLCAAPMGRHIAVDQDYLRRHVKLRHNIAHAPRHGQHRCLEDIDHVDLLRLDHRDRPMAGLTKLLV